MGTDNQANALVTSGRALPARSKHCLRRFQVFLERVKRGECRVGHVKDPENPADFLGKFVDKDKYRRSVDFITNRANAVEPN